MDRARTDIDALLKALERVSDDSIPQTLGGLEVLRARLWYRLVTPPAPEPHETQAQTEDRLLTATEVAERLAVSSRWVYRNAKKLGAVRLSANMVRFPETRVRRFLKRQAKSLCDEI